MKEIVLYSADYNEFLVIEWVGKAYCCYSSDEMMEVLKDNLRNGIGSIFVTDWIFLGEL